jgi:hypothetical protein
VYAPIPSEEESLKSHHLKDRIKLLRENFEGIENQLANLEKREPTRINTDFLPHPPPAPLNVSVEIAPEAK